MGKVLAVLSSVLAVTMMSAQMMSSSTVVMSMVGLMEDDRRVCPHRPGYFIITQS